jgi:hypothetical protein
MNTISTRDHAAMRKALQNVDSLHYYVVIPDAVVTFDHIVSFETVCRTLNKEHVRYSVE